MPVAESPTLAQQALLYRLCGDPNPVHADPTIGIRTPRRHESQLITEPDQPERRTRFVQAYGIVFQHRNSDRFQRELARREAVEMPIVDAVNTVLFEGQSARNAIGALMTRELRAEVDR